MLRILVVAVFSSALGCDPGVSVCLVVESPLEPRCVERFVGREPDRTFTIGAEEAVRWSVNDYLNLCVWPSGSYVSVSALGDSIPEEAVDDDAFAKIVSVLRECGDSAIVHSEDCDDVVHEAVRAVRTATVE